MGFPLPLWVRESHWHAEKPLWKSLSQALQKFLKALRVGDNTAIPVLGKLRRTEWIFVIHKYVFLTLIVLYV